MLNRHFSSERFLAGCLLVALMVGIVFVKFWMVSVERRFVQVEQIFWVNVETDQGHTNVLRIHERRLRAVERTAWAIWDHHAPCDGWPSQQQIARGRDDE